MAQSVLQVRIKSKKTAPAAPRVQDVPLVGSDTGKSGALSMRDHTAELKRVARISGQVEGIRKMIASGRYCPEILQQIKSARAALRGLECSIMESHLLGCVKTALRTDDVHASNLKIKELIELMKAN